jgi:predicted 2-oxoglutarate/Fe(II)-dependent dioxygenase YbiX
MFIKFIQSLPTNQNLSSYQSACFLREYLSNKEVQDCIVIEPNLNFYEGAIMSDGSEKNIVENSVRKTSIAAVPYNLEFDDEFKNVYNIVLKIAADINESKFGFNITAMQLLQYGIYYKDHHYDFHNDVAFYESENEKVMRKISIVFSLNSHGSDYEGGELLLMTHGKVPQTFTLKSGDILAFPSYIPHKVNPVTSGIRKTIVCWLLGPKFV